MKRLLAGALISGLAALSFSAVVFLSNDQAGSNSAPARSSLAHERIRARATSGGTDNSAPRSAEIRGNDNQAKTSLNPFQAAAQQPSNPLPFGANIGGSFDLIDHFGNARQLEDYRGKHVLIFFGYANCLAICSAALPLMGDAINLLGKAEQEKLVALMITVDPKNDTPDFMRKKLAEYHPALVGMTGSEGALADVRSKFQVRSEFVGEDIEGKPIYNHGSFIYLLGQDGEFQTLIPPILGPEQMAKIIQKYITKTDG